MSGYRTVGDGLMLVFVGQILSIFSFLPLLGGILAIIGTIVELVGLYKAGSQEDGYRTAFTLSIVIIVLSFVGLIVPFINLINSILSMVVLYIVCNTTADLLDHCDYETAQRGRTVWKICLGCTIVLVVCAVLLFIPLINVLAAIAAVVTAIVSLVGGILYLMFLYRASDSLRRAG